VPSRLKPAIPTTVWALGFVSLFMDLSSELVHSLLPVFLVTTLGASALTLGLIEGVAEATAMIVKVFSGAISDFFGRRKGLILLGYGLAAITKPLFPLAHSADMVFAARFFDRIGKGIRGAPRDALIADVAPAEIRGACYGLRQTMDTAGAFLGPSLAILLLFLYNSDIRVVMWFAVLPALIAVLLIITGIKEPEATQGPRLSPSHTRLAALRGFPRRYWWVVGVGCLFSLARFSEAFLVLRAQQLGLTVLWLPLVLLTMSLVYSLAAYPAGVVSDRMDRSSVLGIGLVVLIIADLVLAFADSILMTMFGVALWGLHMGLTQGILAAMIADVTPTQLKGTAFGIFNFASGVFLLLASVLAGWLWDQYGAEFTFVAGSLFAVGTLIWLRLIPSSVE